MKKLPQVALGAWAWGNDGTFGNELTVESLQPVFDRAMKNGLNLWDSAYVYGMGTSEKILGTFLKDWTRDSYIISDKLTPQCADYSSDSPVKDMLDMQYQLLGINNMDIYWIHNPVDSPKWIEEVASYYEGKDNAPIIGVSNHNLDEIKEADRILKSHGLRLGAVQNHYSLLNRSSEESGILDYCKNNHIYFFAYMVLEQGALSGKYDTKHPFPAGSQRAEVYNPVLDKLEIMNKKLKEIADELHVSSAQIPVAYAIKKGTIPIVGVTKVNHVDDVLSTLNIKLTDKHVKELENTADHLNLNLIRMWEKKMD